jgi:hypothetical protein
VIGGFAIGHLAGKILFGAKFTLSNTDVGLLAIGSGAFIFALTLAQALIALRSYAASALSWLAGVAGCVVGAVVTKDLFLRSELAYAIGALSAALAMFICLTVRMRSGVATPDVEHLGTVGGHESFDLPIVEI